MAALLIFVALATPFEIAFIETGTEPKSVFVVNKVIDAIFFLDIIVNFNLIIENEQGMFVNDRKMIAMAYVKSWFAIDLVRMLHFVFLIVLI
jgi:hypothetical protein